MLPVLNRSGKDKQKRKKNLKHNGWLYSPAVNASDAKQVNFVSVWKRSVSSKFTLQDCSELVSPSPKNKHQKPR